MATTKASVKAIDFSNVKEGGNFNKKRIPAGDYLAIIKKVEDANKKEGGDLQYLFSIGIVSRVSSVFPYYCQLDEKSLWKLRNLAIAAGKAVPKSKIKFDPNTLVGKKIGVSVEDTEFENKDQSEINAVFPAAELADQSEDAEDENDEAEDEDEDLDMGEDEPEDEVEDDIEEADEGDEWDAITDRTELRRALKKLDPEAKTSTSMSEDDIRDLIRQAAAADEDEDIEDDVEEEEPEPPKKKAPVKTVAKKKKAAEVTDDELDELDIDDL